MKYVKDWDEAKGLVHEVFVTVWEKFDALPADTNYRSYLFTAVRNRSLNYLRDKKKNVLLEQIPEDKLTSINTSLEVSELEREIELGIQSLPEKCRMVFELNRGDGLKYAQIAEKLGISVKTVEAQMSKALSVLKEHLKEFLPLLIFLLGQ
jgi:RNA polymerase sigma-70 factor, ECF subfamily